MAHGRPVSAMSATGIPDEATSNGLRMATKNELTSKRASNQDKLPVNALINTHSSSSSIDSTSARYASGNDKILLPQISGLSTATAAPTTTSSTATDSELDSEQDEQYADDGHGTEGNPLPAVAQYPHQKSLEKSKTDFNVQEQLSRRVKRFQKLFQSEIPDSMPELIDTYVCAYQGDILLQGKMYITNRYLCFHSRIISYVTKHVYRWEQIESVTKERVAFIFPTAIGIQMKHTGKKIIYASFLQRDQAFEKLHSLCSRLNNHESVGSLDDDDDHHRLSHGVTLKALRSEPSSNEKSKQSKRHTPYGTVDEPEHDDVLQMCLRPDESNLNHKQRPQSISSKSGDEKRPHVKERPSSSKRTLSTKDAHLLNGVDTHASENNHTAQTTYPNRSRAEPTLINTSSSPSSMVFRATHRSSSRSRDRTVSPAQQALSTTTTTVPQRVSSLNPVDDRNSSLVNEGNEGFVRKCTHAILLSLISIITIIFDYLALLFDQLRLYPMKISFVLLIFIIILILHSFYLIKLAYRIESRLQSLHHMWPSSALKDSLPSSKEF